jgi:hypothetical protein
MNRLGIEFRLELKGLKTVSVYGDMAENIVATKSMVIHKNILYRHLPGFLMTILTGCTVPTPPDYSSLVRTSVKVEDSQQFPERLTSQ